MNISKLIEALSNALDKEGDISVVIAIDHNEQIIIDSLEVVASVDGELILGTEVVKECLTRRANALSDSTEPT
jgi:DNA repair protein RadC